MTVFFTRLSGAPWCTDMEAPGWHGKLPSLGDFASRRLDIAFVEAWDSWLAEGLSALQTADATGWLQAYLHSPSWQFLLMSNALKGEVGTKAWAGVLMPSVDRVGRYYPFTIAQELPVPPSNVSECQQLFDWCDKLDKTAVAALFDDWTIEQLEDALRILIPPAFFFNTQQTVLTTLSDVRDGNEPCIQKSGLRHVLADYFLGAHPLGTSGVTFWIANCNENCPSVLTAQGLPTGLIFATLFKKKDGKSET